MSDPSPIPLLPRQEVLFDGIPARAVVLEELPAALGVGAIVVSDGDATGVIIARDGSLADVCFVSEGRRMVGAAALDRIREMADATVHAVRLDVELLDALSPVLLWGTVRYADLRLGWTDWYQLVADLRSRDGTHLVELTTPEGRGVTVIADGEHITTYTDLHPEPGDASLLDTLARHPAGTVWVHHVSPDEPQRGPADLWDDRLLGERPGAPLSSPSGGALESPAEPEPASSPSAPSPLGAPYHPPGSPAPTGADPFAVPYHPPAQAPPAGDSPFGAPYRPPEPVAGARAVESPVERPIEVSLRRLLPDLKAVARDRLQLSSPRVERVLDEGSEQDRPVESVFADIRTMAIRGVMRSTLSEMVDDMQSLARRRSSELSAPA